MADKWRKFRDEMKQKRAGKKIEKEGKIEEIVAQRLSSDISGKTPCTIRVAPRELDNIGKYRYRKKISTILYWSISKICKLAKLRNV